MMRTMIFLLATLTASWAHADVSDSGNLSIGGNGVIVGTMTVQGSAFSVGGGTFSVAGGSATFGGIINAAPAGIKWADGSASTTAASGGGAGNVVLNATQTFTGANTFSSTTTFLGYANISTAPAPGVAYSSTVAQAYSWSTTAAGGGVCIAGSTLTINCFGMDIEFRLSGTWSNNGGNANYLIVLVDGKYGMPTGASAVAQTGGIGATVTSIPYTPMVATNLAPGNHSFCLNPYTAASTNSATINWEQIRCVK